MSKQYYQVEDCPDVLLKKWPSKTILETSFTTKITFDAIILVHLVCNTALKS